MSAAKVQRKATEAYQQGLDEVLSALNTVSPVRLEPGGSAGAAQKIRPERVNGGKVGAGMENQNGYTPNSTGGTRLIG